MVHLDDRILGWAPDSYQVMWNLWWFKEQLLSLDNPFRSDILWYPQGTDLYLHTLTPVNGIATLTALPRLLGVLPDGVLFVVHE